MKAKKSLGQNFLKSKNVIKKIIETANLRKEDIVIEIGPGKGILTEELLKNTKKVIAIEKDYRLIEILEEKFKKEIELNKFQIICDDILDFDLKKIGKKEYKVVANIPYYITGQIIRKFLSSDFQPEKMVLMVQKEVAERITQISESILSVSVKVYGEPKYIQTIKAENFIPQPKVDSAILLINNISKDFFKSLGNPVSKLNENDFFNLVRAGFSHKRKILINNISTDLNKIKKLKKSKEKLEEIFKKNKISLKSRAENLSIQDWKNLFIDIQS
ncbi:16S rRNA (adenine(1518)-N(6)/adenine(1519)-N(6))-dimethyltransferase RsmA [Candidatus Parcubacteria bacterium]|nr:16S rRNA (adenine(1518)-N(6)/adenine(1519)-N(6))-dimethyltransferase RsmA [Candidatus Parcubacteria bacterium]